MHDQVLHITPWKVGAETIHSDTSHNELSIYLKIDQQGVSYVLLFLFATVTGIYSVIHTNNFTHISKNNT